MYILYTIGSDLWCWWFIYCTIWCIDWYRLICLDFSSLRTQDHRGIPTCYPGQVGLSGRTASGFTHCNWSCHFGITLTWWGCWVGSLDDLSGLGKWNIPQALNALHFFFPSREILGIRIMCFPTVDATGRCFAGGVIMALCTTASFLLQLKLMMSKYLAHEVSHWVRYVHFYRDTQICQLDILGQCSQSKSYQESVGVNKHTLFLYYKSLYSCYALFFDTFTFKDSAQFSRHILDRKSRCYARSRLLPRKWRHVTLLCTWCLP